MDGDLVVLKGRFKIAASKYFVSFAEEMKGHPNIVRNLPRSAAKLLAGIIYLSFFLVQLDIHLGGAPQDISYFSCDYYTVTEYQAVKHSRNFEICKKPRPVHFRLNKRFQPEKFFETYFPTENIRLVSTIATVNPLIPQEPVLKNTVETLSRRGPPSLV